MFEVGQEKVSELVEVQGFIAEQVLRKSNYFTELSGGLNRCDCQDLYNVTVSLTKPLV